MFWQKRSEMDSKSFHDDVRTEENRKRKPNREKKEFNN